MNLELNDNHKKKKSLWGEGSIATGSNSICNPSHILLADKQIHGIKNHIY